jgi:hypothetical protein
MTGPKQRLPQASLQNGPKGAAEMAERAKTPPDPAIAIQVQPEREILQSRLADLDQTVRQIDQELGQIASRMEGVGEPKVMEGLRSRRRQLTHRREDLLQERPTWVSRLEALTQEEQRAAIDVHLAARRNAQHEGVDVADKLRSALGVVEGLYQRWREWSETDRKLKDMVRSLAPDQVTACPDFSWVTAVDQIFQQSIEQVLKERHRSEAALKSRAA